MPHPILCCDLLYSKGQPPVDSQLFRETVTRFSLYNIKDRFEYFDTVRRIILVYMYIVTVFILWSTVSLNYCVTLTDLFDTFSYYISVPVICIVITRSIVIFFIRYYKVNASEMVDPLIAFVLPMTFTNNDVTTVIEEKFESTFNRFIKDDYETGMTYAAIADNLSTSLADQWQTALLETL